MPDAAVDVMPPRRLRHDCSATLIATATLCHLIAVLLLMPFSRADAELLLPRHAAACRQLR